MREPGVGGEDDPHRAHDEPPQIGRGAGRRETHQLGIDRVVEGIGELEDEEAEVLGHPEEPRLARHVQDGEDEDVDLARGEGEERGRRVVEREVPELAEAGLHQAEVIGAGVPELGAGRA